MPKSILFGRLRLKPCIRMASRTRLAPEGAAKAGLEDEFRPHFFGGVATVVAKLFTQVLPDFALFGQKDYQQLRVVTQMAKDLDLPVKVIGVPTVREPDGLALSSRNVYLSATERAVAPMLYRVLNGCAARIKNGEKIDRVLNVGRIEFDLAGFRSRLSRSTSCSLRSHPFPRSKDGPIRLLAAVRLGKTRLIDNVAGLKQTQRLQLPSHGFRHPRSAWRGARQIARRFFASR